MTHQNKNKKKSNSESKVKSPTSAKRWQKWGTTDQFQYAKQEKRQMTDLIEARRIYGDHFYIRRADFENPNSVELPVYSRAGHCAGYSLNRADILTVISAEHDREA